MNEIFVKLANMSVAAGWLILAVLVLRLALKKAPRWITCLLWAAVAVRLVCPVSLQSPVSAYQVAAPTAVRPSGQVEYFQYVHASGDKPSIQLDVDTIRPAETIGGPTVAAAPADESPAGGAVTRYLPPYVAIWLAVGAALLLYGLASTLRLRFRVREAVRLRDNVWECDAVTSPFLLGLFRPRVYLPSGMDEGQMAYVLSHEQAHLRRLDHIWKPLAYVLLATHWFNPLVWVAYILFCRDIETACDQRAIRDLDLTEKKAYSAALLQCSQGRRMVLACPVAFGEEGVKGRIKAVLNDKKPAFWVVLVALAVCVAVAVCFLTDPVSGGKKGTLTFVEKENIVSTWRADFAVDNSDAALSAVLYADVWKDGQRESTRLLTMTKNVTDLSVQLTRPERNEQMLPMFSLWVITDAYGGYGGMSDGLKEMPKDIAFAAYQDGEKRQVAAGDTIVLAALAADFGGGLPQFDCRALEKQPDIAQNADYMIVVRASFALDETAPVEDDGSGEVLGQDTDNVHVYMLPTFRLPVEVDITGVEDQDSGVDLATLVYDHRWVMHPTDDQPTGADRAITLRAASGDALYIESGADCLLWVSAVGTSAAYSSGMTGDEIIDALSSWAWQMKKSIARSKEAIPDAATFFARFPGGGFRWDIYGQSGSDSGALVGQLYDYAANNTLTTDQCRTLLRNTTGLDGAYAEGYAATLVAAYQNNETAYLQAWQGLTDDQQRAVPSDPDGILPRPAGTIRWSYDQLDAPYMMINSGGRILYMEIPADLAARIQQRIEDNVTLSGFEPPADTHGWSRPLVSWTAERAEVYLRFSPEDHSAEASLRRGDGGVWGIGTESGAVQADAEVRELLSMIAALTGWQTATGRETFSDLTSAELIYNGKTLHTVTDSSHLAQLQNLRQNGTQCSYASQTPMERVQLRLTRSDGSAVSVLLDTDYPRVYLPPFYYYVYNDYESTGTQPLLDALGLTAWPAETADEDCGAWLSALSAELAPTPGSVPSFPLSEKAVTTAVNAVGLPLAISPEETQSYTEGQIAYTLRGDGEDLFPWGAVSSAVYDGGKRYCQVTHLEAAGEDITFHWEDWQKTITLAGKLWGGFSDDDQLYRQLSDLNIPDDSVTGTSWEAETDGGFCRVSYSVTMIQSKPSYVNFTITFYESQQEYRQMMKESMQQRETLRLEQNQLLEQTD